MKNFFLLIVACCASFLGFSQNSELIVLRGKDTLKISKFNLFVFTEKGFFKINSLNKLLYEEFDFQNRKIDSISLLTKKNTFNFFGNDSQIFTFKKEDANFETLGLHFDENGKNISEFDYELCKKDKLDIIINLSDDNFKRIYKELVIGIEDPEDRSQEFTSEHLIRKRRKEFRKRRKELKKHFRQRDFSTISFGNNISIGK